VNEYELRAAAKEAYNRRTVDMLRAASDSYVKEAERSLDDPAYVADATSAAGAEMRNRVASRLMNRGTASSVAAALPYVSSRLRSIGNTAVSQDYGQYVSMPIEAVRSPLVGTAIEAVDPTGGVMTRLMGTGALSMMLPGGGPEDRAKLVDRLRREGVIGNEAETEDDSDNRLTTLQALSAASMHDADHRLAGHERIRKNNPLAYWLDPTIASGPIRELITRLSRRVDAVGADPEQYAPVRALSYVPILNAATAVGGGEDTRSRVRGLLKKELQ